MITRLGWCCVLGLVYCFVGCERPAEVSRFQVPSESPPTTTPPADPSASSSRQRMLAAIIPVDAQVWFFKAMGPVDQVEQVAGEFQQLLGSLTLTAPDKPSWTLPEGWTEQSGNQFRYATLMAHGLEVTVSSLPAPGGNASPKYIVDNINRWRNQLQLSPISVDQMDKAAQGVQIAGRPAYQVDLTGVASADGASMRGPFQTSGGSVPGPSLPASGGGSPVGGPGGDGGLKFTKPPSWQEGKGSSFRLASFIVERDGQSAEITVIALGPAAGSVLDNVNRWRGQVNLSPIDQAQLDSLIQTLEVDGAPGQYVRITDPEEGATQAVFAVIVPRPNQTLFIKMIGPNDLVLAEAEAFEQFVGSIRFASQ